MPTLSGRALDGVFDELRVRFGLKEEDMPEWGRGLEDAMHDYVLRVREAYEEAT